MQEHQETSSRIHSSPVTSEQQERTIQSKPSIHVQKSKSTPLISPSSPTPDSSRPLAPLSLDKPSFTTLLAKKKTKIANQLKTKLASSSASVLPPPLPKSIKRPTLLTELITTNKEPSETTIRKAPRPSTSIRTVSSAPVQIKTSTSVHLVHKKKQTPPSSFKNNNNKEEEEEDEPITKPMSLVEKRKRQAKRADQVKIWKVREEREAREQRNSLRRKLMSGVSKRETAATAGLVTVTTEKKKKKRVKFNFDRNSVIQLPSLLRNDDESNIDKADEDDFQ